MPSQLQRTQDGFFRRKKGGPWWTRWQGEYVSTKFIDLEAARGWRAEREREEASPAYRASQERTLLQGIERLLTDQEDAKRSAGTVEFYARMLAPWREAWGDNFPLGQITAEMVANQIAVQLNAPLKRAWDKPCGIPMFKKRIAALITMLNTAKHYGWIAYDPKSLVPPRGLEHRREKRTRHLTDVEIRKLLRALPEHRAVWLALAIATGGRLSEVNTIKRSAIDLSAGVIHIAPGKTAKIEGSDRPIPIVAATRWLVEWALKHGTNDPDHPDRPICPPWKSSNLIQMAVRYCKRLGLARFSANDLRRTIVTRIVEAGGSDRAAARMLGHQSTAMVQAHYTELGVDALRTLIDRVLPGGHQEDTLGQNTQFRRRDSNPDSESQNPASNSKTPRISVVLPVHGARRVLLFEVSAEGSGTRRGHGGQSFGEVIDAGLALGATPMTAQHR